MKWNDLTLKERKQLYSSVRANNPNATYLDIKQQFDAVPTYEDGGKKIKKSDLPLEYQAGTPEYYTRQRKISGRAEAVQPEAYITPAGYVKDAVNFIGNVSEGNYKEAAVDALLNVIPWGVGKGLKSIRSKLGKASNAISGAETELGSYNFTPTVKVKKGKTSMSDIDAAEVRRQTTERINQNIEKYKKDLKEVYWDAFSFDPYMEERIATIDKNFGTNYTDAYNMMFIKENIPDNELIKYIPEPKGNLKNIKYEEFPIDAVDARTKLSAEGVARYNEEPQWFRPTPDDFEIQIDPRIHKKGVVNHELSHVVDAIETGEFSQDMVNPYMHWLLDRDNIKPLSQLTKEGVRINPRVYEYLTTPTEAKAHLIGLRRAMYQDGKIGTFLQPIDKEMLESSIYKLGDPTLITQYQLYKDKNRFIQRLNSLTPMDFVTPIATGASLYNLSKEE